MTSGADCVWVGAGSPGDASARDLEAGEVLDLASGTARILFATGTRMNIAGPVRITLKSTAQCDLAQGRLFAHVPPAAVGFRISTPTADVIDLGTDFGVEVDGQGQASVNVLTGKVDVLVVRAEGSSGQAVRVEANQAVRIGRDKLVVPVPFEKQKLVVSVDPADEIRSPADVQGLQLWLTTQRGLVTDEAGHVIRWADQSGHGYDAAQSESARRPLLVDPLAVGPLEQGAGVALRFDGVDDYLECPSGLDIDGAADSTFFVLLRKIGEVKPNMGIFSLRSREHADWNSADGFALTLSAKNDKTIQAMEATPYGSNPGSDNLVLAADLPDDGPYLVAITKKRGTATLRLGGNTRQVDSFAIRSDGGQFSVNTAGYVLGARADDGRQRPGISLPGNVEIAEVLAYSPRLSAPKAPPSKNTCASARTTFEPHGDTVPSRPRPNRPRRAEAFQRQEHKGGKENEPRKDQSAVTAEAFSLLARLGRVLRTRWPLSSFDFRS